MILAEVMEYDDKYVTLRYPVKNPEIFASFDELCRFVRQNPMNENDAYQLIRISPILRQKKKTINELEIERIDNK